MTHICFLIINMILPMWSVNTLTCACKFMMTSSNGNIFRVTGLCAGNSPVIGEFPAQRPVTQSFDVFLDLRLNKRLNKQLWGWWFETPSGSLWLHCNVKSISCEGGARHIVSTAWCKTAVSPLSTHWRYCSLALNHLFNPCRARSGLFRSN